MKKFAFGLGLSLLLGACSSPPLSPEQAGGRDDVTTQSLAPALCGDVQHLYVVAHQDDDLLFMNPDLSNSIKLGHCVSTAYITTSQNWPGINYYNTLSGVQPISYDEYGLMREAGIRAAYAQMANAANEWTEGTFRVAGKNVKMFTLKADARVSLFFLRLPDDASGQATQSTLVQLWYGNTARLSTVDNLTSYSRSELVATLAGLMRQAAPRYVHIQDSEPREHIRDEQGNKRDDHADHIIGALFAQEARKSYAEPHLLARYRDYNIILEANPNLTETEARTKLDVFDTYAENDVLICPPGTSCDIAQRAVTDGDVYADFLGWTQRQLYNIENDQQGSVLMGASGAQVFVLGDRTSTLRSISAATATGTTWNRWRDLGGNFSATPIVVPYANGRLAAFVRTANGTLRFSRELGATGTWSAWQDLGGQGASDAAVIVNERGQLQVFAVSTGARIISRIDATSSGTWSPWFDIGDKFFDFSVWSNPAVARTSKNRPALFVRDAFGRVRVATQNAGANNWTKWTNLGGNFDSDPAAGRGADGFAAVFVRGADAKLYWSRETATGWSAWAKIGDVTFGGTPIVTNGVGGRLELFVRDTDGAVRHVAQTSSTAWGGWNYLYGGFTSVVGATRLSDGRLQVFARKNADGLLYVQTQASVGAWSGIESDWISLGR